MGEQRDNWCRTAPFPEIPIALRERFSVGELSLRAFGVLAEDLEVDFALSCRPALEIRILYCCTQGRNGECLAEEFFWELEIGKRTQCLVIIAALSEKRGLLSVPVRCPNTDCRLEMELEFSVDELIRLQPERSRNRRVEIPIAGEDLPFRRPVGRDQLAWLGQSFADTQAAIEAMIATLAVGNRWNALRGMGGLDEEGVKAIGAALAASDPWLNCTIPIGCPDCGREQPHSPDLAALALARLRHAQDDLLELVHALASHYHWTEEQILAIAPWRRTRYRALIDKQERR